MPSRRQRPQDGVDDLSLPDDHASDGLAKPIADGAAAFHGSGVQGALH
jgi:hypothetical protein